MVTLRRSTVRASSVLGLLWTFHLLLFSALASAQDIPGLPLCAETCAETAGTAVGCNLNDTLCICSSRTFTTAVEQCAGSPGSGCTSQDRDTTERVLNTLCQNIPKTATGNNTQTSTHSDSTSSISTTPGGHSTSSVAANSTTSTLETPIPPITTAPFPTSTSPGSTDSSTVVPTESVTPGTGTGGLTPPSTGTGTSLTTTVVTVQTQTTGAGTANTTSATSGAGRLGRAEISGLGTGVLLFWAAGAWMV